MSADLELAERAARAAGAVLLERYGRPPEGLDLKSSATDPVSDADREAERAIRELLRSERPDDGLLAEEGSRSDARNERRWVVDPLDGTVNYLYQLPAWSVSVALEDAEGTRVGVVFDPLRGELFRAERGAGAQLVRGPEAAPRGHDPGAGAQPVRGPDAAPRGHDPGGDARPLRVRAPVALADALVATGFAYRAEERRAQAAIAAEVLPRVRDIRRAGSAALDLCWVAAGRLDAFYERGPQTWDTAAGALLVDEAGGVVQELPGAPRGVLAASGERLAGDLLALVA